MAHFAFKLLLLYYSYYLAFYLFYFYILVLLQERDIPANVMEEQRQRVEDTICRQQLQANIQSENKQHTKFKQLKNIKLTNIFKIGNTEL
jgi:hypothetical protein